MLKDLDAGLEGRHVIIVEDIVDTGLTLTYLQDILRARAPKSLKTACLLSKPSRRKVDVAVEYVGFTIEDRFVVGYGLDYAEKYRNLRAHRGAGRRNEAIRHHHRGRRPDARLSGRRVELAAGGHVTPLAQGYAGGAPRHRRRAGAADPNAAGRPGAGRDVRRVAIGSDHTGVALKRALCSICGDEGWRSTTSAPTDPIRSTIRTSPAAVGPQCARKEADAGIVIDGAGIGSAIAANKIRGVRAAMCMDETMARYSREHNGANVLTLGATLVPWHGRRARIVDMWLGTPMREARYIRRLLKIRRLEERP